MAYSKEDFDRVIINSVSQFPELAALYQVGDPRLLQAQSAIAQMMAMMSQQIELGAMEPFDKVRDSTVLADASLKGLMPMATPARVKVKVENPTNAEFAIGAGRGLLDSSGRMYVADSPVTVPAGGVGHAELLQKQVRAIEHTVTVSQAFYKIEVPQPVDGRFISGISVADAAGTPYTYSVEFTNVANGDKVFHVECDEYRRLFVVFGYAGYVGYQPSVGEVLTLTVYETTGDVRPDAGSPFALDYAIAPQDGLIKITMDSLLIPGAAPIDIATLRELCKYPSAYDQTAVYLGEFDFLVRRNIAGLKFLSIWNETIEELVRGPSLDNINRLFVSFVPPDGATRESIEQEVLRVIKAADDSYRIVFITPAILAIGMTIVAEVARIHDAVAVKKQILDVLLKEYGEKAVPIRAGMLVVKYKAIYALLKNSVQALQDSGSDFSVTITPMQGKQLPEHFRYMTPESLNVSVTLANYNLGSWGQ